MKAWTVLVYLAGDNGHFLSSLESEGVADLLEMKEIGSGPAIDVVAQFDRMTDRACRRYHLTRGDDLSGDIVQDLGETNSGDTQVLLDFITWGVRAFPAQRYLLVLWNHGSGWRDDDIYAPYRALSHRRPLPLTPPQISGRRVSRALFRRTLEATLEEEANQAMLAQAALRVRGQPAPDSLPAGWLAPASTGPSRAGSGAEPTIITAQRGALPPHARAICFDDSSKDFIDSVELGDVLASAATLIGKRIDVLGMDACLMSMIEVAYQLHESVRVMVGSEDAEPGSGWPYATILAALVNKPEMSGAELGGAIADCYVHAYDGSMLAIDPITQSALDLDMTANAVKSLDDLSAALLKGWRRKGTRPAVITARSQAQSFMDPDYIDLFDFISLLATQPGAHYVHDACGRLLAALDPAAPRSLVLADRHAGLAERNAHGLSIYFPKTGVSPFYAGLAMSRDCSWARFLDSCLG